MANRNPLALAAGVVALAALICTSASADPARPWLEAPSLSPQWLSEARPKKIRRIVTVAPSVTELLFALGVGARVVGVSRYDDFPEEVKALPKVGGFLDPNVEAIVALSPDLVLGVANAGNRVALDRIASLGVPVFVVPGNTFADVFHGMRAVGDVLGGKPKAEAKKLGESLTAELTSLSKQLAGRPAPTIAVVYGWNPLVVAGPGSFADTMVRALRGENIVKGGPAYPSWSVEQLISSAPQVIIDTSGAHGGGASPWEAWTTIPAVRDHRVFALELGELMRPGPRLADGMRRMAELLHPEAFPAK